MQSLIACRTADPVLNFDPQPQQRSVMRGSCLTQNGAWFRSQKDGGRCTEVEGGRARERAAHRGLIYPLSDFSSPPLRSLLFSLRRNYCPFSQYISLSSLSSSAFFGMAARRHQRPPSPLQVGIHGNRDQQDSGRGKMRDEPLMRARPRHPGRNVCK